MITSPPSRTVFTVAVPGFTLVAACSNIRPARFQKFPTMETPKKNIKAPTATANTASPLCSDIRLYPSPAVMTTLARASCYPVNAKGWVWTGDSLRDHSRGQAPARRWVRWAGEATRVRDGRWASDGTTTPGDFHWLPPSHARTTRARHGASPAPGRAARPPGAAARPSPACPGRGRLPVPPGRATGLWCQ